MLCPQTDNINSNPVISRCEDKSVSETKAFHKKDMGNRFTYHFRIRWQSFWLNDHLISETDQIGIGSGGR